jgi:hypothetical protein
MTKQSFRNRAKELFKSVFNVPYATNSLIKKHYPWFRNTSECWAKLVDELSLVGLENDEEVVNIQYGVIVKSNHPFTRLEKFNPVSKRVEFIGMVSKSLVTGMYSYSQSSHGSVSRKAFTYEAAVKALVANAKKEQQAYTDLFAV